MYQIYEIPGVKIGCTEEDQWERREKANHKKYGGSMILLETHTCIYEASRREIELQKEKGYPVDSILYWKFIQLPKKAIMRGGRKGGSHPNSSLQKQIASEIGKRTVGQLNIKNKVCPHCGKVTTPAGLTNHLKACRKKEIS